ncbi:unnamed protein product [Fusarium venenatum]|uniref:Nucleoside phosphorylase domain-containing protein n=1 Tax=Fusarium venenatum TaxID=56646 RepID=A0A2L2T2L2_9HYPO|nr:uncharacterized protein FVRRES_00241 [Fusarium venenatum]KAH7006499.1 nucleoside phosphorylase domain-containing protein [Fusarium venenatum]CEI63729.1 unnamed protein product [Fusarium venenatum]
MSRKSGVKRSDVEIAIICALPTEARAIQKLMENTSNDTVGNPDYSGATKTQPDENAYTLGEMDGHPVVLVHMPSVGKISATFASTHLKHTYTAIKLALLAGICGGVPKNGDEVKRRLGDVVIGTSVVQFDMGRQYPDKFEQSEHSQALLGKPSVEIQAFIKKLESSKEVLQQRMQTTITENIATGFRLADDLYDATYWHIHRDADCCIQDEKICDTARRSTCESLHCDDLDRREKRTELKPIIHFGPVGCGDTVMKSGTHRDNLAKGSKVIALDMEGAGTSMHQACLFVKSISDYADSHKNKDWQEHASLASAACVKAIIGQWHLSDKSALKSQAVRIQNVTVKDSAMVSMVAQDPVLHNATFNLGHG